MQRKGVCPNKFTFVQVIKVCVSLGTLEDGKLVHKKLIQIGCEFDVFVGSSLVDIYAKCQIIQSGLELDVFVGSSLVDTYAKCGSMEDAWSVFNKMPSRNVVTWTTILGGCAIHGHEGVQPNDITFICLLSACNHAGLVDEGMRYYASMTTNYMIIGKSEHYACMEAKNMVMAIFGEPHVATWKALLSACRIHGNVEMAKCIAKRILEIEPKNAASYVLLSNIYSAHWYMPVTKIVLHDVEEEESIFHLCHHSENLAIACGLINIALGTTLQIRKNLQFISKIVGRVIMVRDANHFHHCKDCVCSCMNYW
ncbi:hypothetical protein CY35_18G001700 [Sphagnum magellanicum]|nr:hypothetical protein CY35_18G001700 [Sphagnum magellanicum]